ncbi:MAG TPA: thiamine phosphate synthase [Puia sp.]|nr:thiamine phosphate synthase [Puia sp.]
MAPISERTVIGGLNFITKDDAPLNHLQQVEAACRAGIRWIQLRMKQADDRTFLETAHAARKICDTWGCMLILNDRVELAAEAGAQGVHVGLQDMSVADARRLLGEGFIIGGTANTIEDIRRHYEQGADYIGLGPYRFTDTKKNLSPLLGLQGYQRIMTQLREEGIGIPVVAIGGIGGEDIGALVDAGVAGIAFSGLLVRAGDWESTVRGLEMEFGRRTADDSLTIAGRTFRSRLFIGTGKFGSSRTMEEALLASGSELVTVALRRVDVRAANSDDLLLHLHRPHIHLLPNTSGVRNAKEAIFAAELAREALGTHWLKLEIHPDPRWLMPDPVETLLAAEILVKKGFVVLPYIHADPVLCRRLEDAGVAAVMPLGSPIGSNKGLRTQDFLEIIIAQSRVPVIVDAGIGSPSDASKALEMGADAVLVNTAIAASPDAVRMARAFRMAVEAGRMAYTAKLALPSAEAVASSPLTAFLDE